MNRYPIRVLKRKISSTTNAPLVVDGTDGSLKIPKVQKSGANLWKPLAIVATLVALTIVMTQTIIPVIETSLNNKKYSKLATASSTGNKIKNLQLIQIKYSVDSKGRRVATAPTASNDLKKTLDYLKTVPDVEEVTADKEQIKVSFFAAD
jgi:hypothetical protein